MNNGKKQSINTKQKSKEDSKRKRVDMSSDHDDHYVENEKNDNDGQELLCENNNIDDNDNDDKYLSCFIQPKHILKVSAEILMDFS